MSEEKDYSHEPGLVATNIPEHGLAVSKALMQYADNAAQYTERLAQDLEVEAKAIAEAFRATAADIRKTADALSERSVDFTMRVREAGKGIEAISRRFKENYDKVEAKDVPTDPPQRSPTEAPPRPSLQGQQDSRRDRPFGVYPL